MIDLAIDFEGGEILNLNSETINHILALFHPKWLDWQRFYWHIS
jgi:hypothetical protein